LLHHDRPTRTLTPKGQV